MATAAMHRGEEPTSPPVEHLARKWNGLVPEFTGGHQNIAQAAGRTHRQELGVAAKFGLDAKMFEYITRASASLRPSGRT